MAEFFSIDIHTHILPENIPDFGARYGYRGFIHLDRRGGGRFVPSGGVRPADVWPY